MLIEVNDLVFEYPGKRALHGISLEIKEGSVTALVGPNGAGKTTLMRCMAALERPFSGSVSICGYNTELDPRACHRRIGYLADLFGLYDGLTVEQSLLFIAANHRIEAKEARSRVRQIVTDLELENYFETPASDLSRGLRQRLAIGQAMVHQPELLIFDEPASGLDPEARHSLSGLFRSLCDKGKTLIVSSHILSELEDYSDCMLTLRDGRLIGSEFLEPKTRAGEQQFVVSIAKNFAPPAEKDSVEDSLVKKLEGLDSVSEVQKNAGQVYFLLNVEKAEPDVVLKLLVAEHDLPVSEFRPVKKRMSETYLQQVSGAKEEDQSTGGES